MKQEVIIDRNLIDTNIEALKEELERVKKSELRHRQFLQGLQVPIYTTDAHGFILFYNNAAVALWGREPEIGKDKWCGSYKIYNTDGVEIPLHKCPVAIAIKEARSVLPEEIILVGQHGSKKNVTIHPQPIFDENGEVVGAVNMLLDATVLKTSEQALLGNQ